MPEHNTPQATLDRREEAVQRLTQAQATLSQNHANLAQTQTSMTTKLDSVLKHLATLTIPSPIPLPPPHTISPPPPSPKPHMKLDVPHFDGQDPVGWIFKISQFFDYQGLLDHERITVASFYMDGPALSWYQWMTRNRFISSWSALLQALESRFAPTFYEDPQGPSSSYNNAVLLMIT